MRYSMVSAMAIVCFATGLQATTLGRSVAGSSGGRVTGGTYTLNFTIGQPVIGNLSGATNAKLGYWAVITQPSSGGGGDPFELDSAPSSTNRVEQNVPNPFNPQTRIEFTVRQGLPAQVRISIYDGQGRLVRELLNREMNAGPHSVQWDGRHQDGSVAATGVYLYRVQIGDFDVTKKLVLLK